MRNVEKVLLVLKMCTFQHYSCKLWAFWLFFKYGPIPASFRVYSLLSFLQLLITTNVQRSLYISAPCWQDMSLLPELTQQTGGSPMLLILYRSSFGTPRQPRWPSSRSRRSPGGNTWTPILDLSTLIGNFHTPSVCSTVPSLAKGVIIICC